MRTAPPETGRGPLRFKPGVDSPTWPVGRTWSQFSLGRNSLRLDRVELGLADGTAVEQPLGLLNLGGRSAVRRHRPDVVVDLRLGGLGLLHVTLAHLLAVGNQV